jgi:hypothetical protein
VLYIKLKGKRKKRKKKKRRKKEKEIREKMKGKEGEGVLLKLYILLINLIHGIACFFKKNEDGLSPLVEQTQF